MLSTRKHRADSIFITRIFREDFVIVTRSKDVERCGRVCPTELDGSRHREGVRSIRPRDPYRFGRLRSIDRQRVTSNGYKGKETGKRASAQCWRHFVGPNFRSAPIPSLPSGVSRGSLFRDSAFQVTYGPSHI